MIQFALGHSQTNLTQIGIQIDDAGTLTTTAPIRGFSRPLCQRNGLMRGIFLRHVTWYLSLYWVLLVQEVRGKQNHFRRIGMGFVNASAQEVSGLYKDRG